MISSAWATNTYVQSLNDSNGAPKGQGSTSYLANLPNCRQTTTWAIEGIRPSMPGSISCSLVISARPRNRPKRKFTSSVREQAWLLVVWSWRLRGIDPMQNRASLAIHSSSASLNRNHTCSIASRNGWTSDYWRVSTNGGRATSRNPANPRRYSAAGAAAGAAATAGAAAAFFLPPRFFSAGG